MRAERLSRIVYPRYYTGVKVNHAGFPERGYTVLSFDTETVKGWPYTLQFCADGENATLDYLEPEEFLGKLISYIQPFVNQHHHPNVVLFGFNLAYDLPAILYPQAAEFAKGSFTVEHPTGVRLEVFYGRVPFAKFTFPSKRIVWMIDAYTFVWSSLDKAADTWNLPTKKLKHPKGLGQRVLRSREFVEYAKQDTIVTWHLGQEILRFHKRYDIRLCVSIAQAAGRVFAHHFLKKPLPRVPADVEQAALLSYHGGKNGFYLDRPQWVKECYEYDLQSAYPWAMSQMPSLSKGSWHTTATFDTVEGFYCVTGRAATCVYPILYDHEFKPVQGCFSQVWVTGYELREAIARKEVQIDTLRGFVWKPTSSDTPLRDYVEHFYKMKQASLPGLLREQNKLLLNSLYGKFIQMTTNPVDKSEHPGVYFHPVLASWITGCVRARIHTLEHRYSALHTATDAIHTIKEAKTLKGLGNLERKQFGPAFLVRNKVYFHFGEEDVKYAHHGIRTNARKLWRMLLQGRTRYTVLHLLKPREAIRMGTRPLQPVWKPMQIVLAPYKIRPIPRGVPPQWRK